MVGPGDLQTERNGMTSVIPESHRDLLEAPVATLATIGPDRRPQLSAVWFLAENDTLRVSLNTRRQKTKNLQAHPATNLFILDTANPSRYLEIRGDAQIEPDDDYSFAAEVGAKYGADLRQMDGPGESRVVVTIKPTRINAVDLSA
jgi:PPOX class probable F420-dependent enzyme